MDEPTKVRRTKAVTIYDVAREAGVAASTVSRAFTRPGRVSEATEAHIRAVAARLGYVARASTARGRRTSTPTIVVGVAGFGSLYYHQTLEGIHQEAAKTKADVLIADCRQDLETERRALAHAAGIADAMILVSPRIPDVEISALAARIPLVVINRIMPGVPSVVQNVPDGMDQIVTHLWELGHRSLMYIGGPSESWMHITRWEAIRGACDAHGMQVDRVGPFGGSATARAGVNAADAWMRHRTSAVVAYNDETAIGFVKAAVERGLRVPEDVSVVGIDNSALAQLFIPSLTSLALAGHAQGAVAGRMMVDTLAGEETQTGPILVPMKLSVGRSTGPVSAL